MTENLYFDACDYDLEGLLSLAEQSMADFIFMIQEDDLETYYMDRIENQKYDSSFSKFTRRAKDYLEADENRSLFVLFAKGVEEQITLFDGAKHPPRAIDTGEIELDESTFYGMMIHHEGEEYIFHEALFVRESYQADAHGRVIQEAGELSELLRQFVLTFK